jgi:hypothetical protein
MPAGYSGTPLARKLGIRAGHRVGTIAAPDAFPGLLDPLPEDVRLEAVPEPPADADTGDRDVVIAFAPDRAALADRLDRGRRLIHPDGGLWIAWPKMASPLHRDLRRDAVRAMGLDTGLVDNKVCAIDDDWSALRFVYRTEDRPG